MKHLLIPVDFSAGTDRILAAAARIGRREECVLHLLHVAPPEPDFIPFDAGPDTVRDQVAEDLRQEHRSIQELAARLTSDGFQASARMVQGSTVETILEWAERVEADCIVMGSHNRGALHRLVLGSISEGVLRKTQRPVLVVPALVTT